MLGFLLFDDLFQYLSASPSESWLFVGELYFLDKADGLEYVDYVIEASDFGLNEC